MKVEKYRGAIYPAGKRRTTEGAFKQKVVGALLEGHRGRAHWDSQQGPSPRWPRMTWLPYVLGRQRGVLGGEGEALQRGFGCD